MKRLKLSSHRMPEAHDRCDWPVLEDSGNHPLLQLVLVEPVGGIDFANLAPSPLTADQLHWLLPTLHEGEGHEMSLEPLTTLAPNFLPLPAEAKSNYKLPKFI